ncbi:Adenylate cyclase 2 [Babesia sp. Xinjiang]|uniref:Adenylate cyclase 2 n=1 Tax=Babesia sp. Xinjiang TaxID=462227 RepID=UPI000A21B86A|nr:Adenylate cyclase 2 [Babesia sp. Xinjiang]ORM40335.1 Adenylate cyclase 2 [Babesia sp. Xinjiang]
MSVVDQTVSILQSAVICCATRGKGETDPAEDPDFIDIADAIREEEQMREEWQWLSIRCERRLNEQLCFYKKEIAERYDAIKVNASTATAPSQYTSYVPKLIRRFIYERLGGPKSATRSIDDCYAVTVFCDVSGFTALAEAIERSGDPEAAATLGRSLNSFFDPLICIINRWGGDIMKFAGDAVLVAWIVTDTAGAADSTESSDSDANTDNSSFSGSKELQEPSIEAVWKQCALALKCCEELHKTLHEFPTNIEGKTLSMHIGMGFGKICVIHVGGLMERWDFVIAGKPLEEIAVAEPLASTGQTVMSRSVYEVMSNHLEVDKIEGHEDYFVFRNFAEEVDVLPGAIVDETFDFPMEAITEFQHYMPSYIFSRLLSGYSVFNNEMRRLSTVFISVPGLDVATTAGRDTAHQLMKICQRAAYALEGSVNKFLVDDKGVVLLIFIGFPPVYHTDDPVRSVFVGLKVANDCAKLGLHHGIGITTGSVWCGTLGNDTRREYTCLGDYVNLSARLMAMAAKSEQHRIIVDEATARAAGSILEFIDLESVKLKGKEQWVKVFTPTGKVRRLDPQVLQSLTPLETWRRWDAYNDVKDRLFGSSMLEHGGVMLINGHNGCGTVEMQSSITRLVKKQGYANCFSLSTMKDDSSAISIASDLHFAWRNLCNSLVSTWASSASRKAMMGAYHSKYRYVQSEHGVSKKAVSDIVKEMLDPALHWRLGSIKPLVLGLEVEPLQKLLGQRVIPPPQTNPGIMGLLQSWTVETKDADVESNSGSEHDLDVDSAESEDDDVCDTTLLDQRIMQEPIAPFVSSMVDGFSMRESICVVLNLRMGSSVYATMEDDSWETVCQLARLAMERRREHMAGTTNSKPILFIVISLPQHVFIRWHDELVEFANECNALVKLSKLTQAQLADFVAHALELENTDAAPAELVDHVYQNTSGMARFAYMTLENLVESGAIVLNEIEESVSSVSSDEEEQNTLFKSCAMRRKEILEFFRIPRRHRSGFGTLEQMRELGVSFEEPVRNRKRLTGLNLTKQGLIDEILSFAMSIVDRLQPDELFVAKVACVLRPPFVRQDLLGSNPQGFDAEQFDAIVRSLLANEILESVSNMPIAEAAGPNVQLRLASTAIAHVLSQRVLEEERAWFADHFALA